RIEPSGEERRRAEDQDDRIRGSRSAAAVRASRQPECARSRSYDIVAIGGSRLAAGVFKYMTARILFTSVILSFIAASASAQIYSPRKPRRQFITIGTEWLRTQPLHFL